MIAIKKLQRRVMIRKDVQDVRVVLQRDLVTQECISVDTE